jgi:1-acyl-sn-glycerol-3-phosphate acyltransferase
VTRAARSSKAAPGVEAPAPPLHDRPWYARAWYELIRFVSLTCFSATGGLRAGGRGNLPRSGGALLVCNHGSYLDVFVIGIPSPRPLNYVARSTLFFPPLGGFIRSVGGFPIQREGMGASGLKEILRRVRNGGIVILFPEGTRSPDGTLGEVKPGIAVLAARTKTPLIPAGIAGTFEAWPRYRLFPRPHPIRVEYGPPIFPEELAGLTTEQVTTLIHDRIDICHRRAVQGLAQDMGLDPPAVRSPKRELGPNGHFD